MVCYLKIVKSEPDLQVVEVLQLLLQEAKAGRITGLAYATLEDGHRFTADVVGRCRTSPLLAIGLTRVLEEATSKLVE